MAAISWHAFLGGLGELFSTRHLSPCSAALCDLLMANRHPGHLWVSVAEAPLARHA